MSDFPTVDAIQPYPDPPTYAIDRGFVTKLSAAGSKMIFSTYLGGRSGALVGGLAVDRWGNIYMAGETISIDFPTTRGAFQRECPANCGSEAFILKIDTRRRHHDGPGRDQDPEVQDDDQEREAPTRQ